MTSIGTGYDLSNSVFSPDGRNFQVEYAMKAVENGGTSIGIKCKDGVVLAVEKIIQSKLLVPGKINESKLWIDMWVWYILVYYQMVVILSIDVVTKHNHTNPFSKLLSQYQT